MPQKDGNVVNAAFIYEGDEAPEHCPTCGYPKAFFERMCENY